MLLKTGKSLIYNTLDKGKHEMDGPQNTRIRSRQLHFNCSFKLSLQGL